MRQVFPGLPMQERLRSIRVFEGENQLFRGICAPYVACI
jgi:hypothetical protein